MFPFLFILQLISVSWVPSIIIQAILTAFITPVVFNSILNNFVQPWLTLATSASLFPTFLWNLCVPQQKQLVSTCSYTEHFISCYECCSIFILSS